MIPRWEWLYFHFIKTDLGTNPTHGNIQNPHIGNIAKPILKMKLFKWE